MVTVVSPSVNNSSGVEFRLLGQRLGTGAFPAPETYPAHRNPPVPPPVRISPRPLRSGASWTVEGDIPKLVSGIPLSSGAKPKLKSPHPDN
jgi:hypothetical protein